MREKSIIEEMISLQREYNHTLMKLERMKMKKLEESIKTLQEELAKDKSEGSYYYSWQANIAMAFQDEWNRSKVGKFMNDNEPEWLKDVVPNREKYHFVHKIANQAAKNFLDLLIKK